jgi:hypothetical protein
VLSFNRLLRRASFARSLTELAPAVREHPGAVAQEGLAPMHGKSKQGGAALDLQAEHLVVLQVAGVFYGRSREQLHGTLNDLGSRRVNAAIKSLEAVGVVVVNGHTIRQSRALARIERLGYISV